MEDSRHVTNEAVRLGLEYGITSRKEFHNKLYHEIDSNLCKSVKQTAIYLGKSLLKARRTRIKKDDKAGKTPYIWNSSLRFTNQNYKIKDGFLIVSAVPKTPIKIKLCHYVLKKLADKELKLGSVEITPTKIIMAYSKYVTLKIPAKYVGIDMNFKNVSTCNTDEKMVRYDTSPILKKKEKYRATVSKFKRNDVRIRKKIAGKYGKKSRNMSKDMLHKLSTLIILSGYYPLLEDLKEINKLWDKQHKRGKT